MDTLAAHAQAAVSGQSDQKGTFAVKVRPIAALHTCGRARGVGVSCGPSFVAGMRSTGRRRASQLGPWAAPPMPCAAHSLLVVQARATPGVVC